MLSTVPAPQLTHSSSRRSALVWLFLGAALLRLTHIAFLAQAPFWDYKIGDAARYDAWAHEIASGDWLGQKAFYQAPLYPYFLAVLYSVLGDKLLLVRLVQAGLGSLSCCLLAAAGWNLFGRRAGLIAGWTLAVYAPSIFLEGLLQKSVLDLLFICLILWYFSRESRQSSGWNGLGLGASLGGLALCRENAVVLLPLFGVWIVWNAWRRTVTSKGIAVSCPREKSVPGWGRVEADRCVGSKKLRRAGLAAATWMLGSVLTLGPVAFRNYWVSGEWHLTTSQLGPNFYIGNNPQADGYYQPLEFARGDAQYEQADAVAIAEAARGRRLTAREVSQYYLAQSMEFICQKPVQWLSLLGHKFLLSLNRLEIIDTEDQYVAARYSPILWLCGCFGHFGTVLALGWIGLVQTRKRWPELWPLYVMLALFWLTLIAFFVFGRYRFPIVPVLILFASPVLGRMSRRWQRCGWGGLRETFNRQATMSWSASLLLLCACLPLISWPAAAATTYNNFAIQALLRQDWERARDFVESSLRANPRCALAYNSRGVLSRELGELDAAAHDFELALRLAPEYQTARRNLERLPIPDSPSTGDPESHTITEKNLPNP